MTTFVILCTDDDNGSGYGDNPMVGYWYGSREECEAIDPMAVVLCPLTVDGAKLRAR